jgi:hypothetical protein
VFKRENYCLNGQNNRLYGKQYTTAFKRFVNGLNGRLGEQWQQVATPASRRGGGAADAQPVPGGGGGDTKAKVRQQKSEDRDATPNLLLKHPDAILAIYV